MRPWETDGEMEAIKHIEESMEVKRPDNQLGMPDACNTKIQHLKKAIEELEHEIKILESTAKQYNIYGNYINTNNNNNTNNLMLGGKRPKKIRQSKKLKRTLKIKYSKK